MAGRVSLDQLTEDYRRRRRAELLAEVDEASFDQRDEERHDNLRADADRTIEEELRDVTPSHPVERGFFWGTVGVGLLALGIPDNDGATLTDAEMALAGGVFGAVIGLCVRYSRGQLPRV